MYHLYIYMTHHLGQDWFWSVQSELVSTRSYPMPLCFYPSTTGTPPTGSSALPSFFLISSSEWVPYLTEEIVSESSGLNENRCLSTGTTPCFRLHTVIIWTGLRLSVCEQKYHHGWRKHFLMIFAPNALHCNGRPTPGIWHTVNEQDWSKGKCMGTSSQASKLR